jgi:phosphomannomutase
VVVGCDIRLSSEDLKQATIKGLMMRVLMF